MNFEEEQLRATQARLTDLENVIRTEDEALVRHEQTKLQIEAGIQDAEASIEELREDLAKANEDLENRTTEVEQAKKAFNKAAKAVDQVLKDIATKVCKLLCFKNTLTVPHLERRNREARFGAFVYLQALPDGRNQDPVTEWEPQKCSHG